MKRINVRFERDPSLAQIEVLVRASERDGTVTALIERLSGQPPDLLKVTDTGGARLELVTGDIIAATVRDKLTVLTTEHGQYTVRQSLQSMEGILLQGRFLRISRHELINMDKIERYDFTVSGTLRLELAGDMETWASRRFIPIIRRWLNGKE